VIGTPLLLIKVVNQRKLDMDSKQWRNNFIFSIVLGIFVGTAYFTGPDVADWIKGILDNYSQDLVEDHGFWGRVAFVIQVIGALIGIMGLASILQEEKPDKRISYVLMFLLAINTGVMIYTAHLGGYIRRIDLM
jgi:O-antigen/teichoic acid export membrane protein